MLCQFKSYDITRLAPCDIHACLNLFYLLPAKNRTSHQNNDASSSENTLKVESRSKNAVLSYQFNPILPIELLRRKMWQNTRNCVNFVSVLVNNTRGLKTVVSHNAARSSPAQPGYASEDRILQIKQHQNDFTKQFPSVTLILNKTMTEESRAALEKWKQERIAEIGEEEFKKFYEGT